EKALALGPCKVIPQEHTNIRCYNIDLALPLSEDSQEEALAEHLQAEFYSASPDPVVAYRGGHRWIQAFEPAQLESCATATPRLRRGGVYLILGGLGRFGLLIAKYLAANFKARLILTGKTGLPERAGWDRRVA